MVATNKLKAKLIESGYTYKSVSNLMGVTVTTLGRKVRNETEFSASEIKMLITLLGLTRDDTFDIFFNTNVTDSNIKN